MLEKAVTGKTQPFLWINKSLCMRLLFFIAFFSLSFFSSAQQQATNSIAITADYSSGTLSYSRKFNKILQPGILIGVGRSLAISHRRNHLSFIALSSRLQLFNRFEPWNIFHLDAGFGIGNKLEIEKSYDEYERESILVYTYINPMIGGKHLKAGLLAGMGRFESGRKKMLFTSLPMIRYTFLF
jgi:hypothetical protein